VNFNKRKRRSKIKKERRNQHPPNLREARRHAPNSRTLIMGAWAAATHAAAHTSTTLLGTNQNPSRTLVKVDRKPDTCRHGATVSQTTTRLWLNPLQRHGKYSKPHKKHTQTQNTSIHTRPECTASRTPPVADAVDTPRRRD
jgi:hypothetical protein